MWQGLTAFKSTSRPKPRKSFSSTVYSCSRFGGGEHLEFCLREWKGQGIDYFQTISCNQRIRWSCDCVVGGHGNWRPSTHRSTRAIALWATRRGDVEVAFPHLPSIVMPPWQPVFARPVRVFTDCAAKNGACSVSVTSWIESRGLLFRKYCCSLGEVG